MPHGRRTTAQWNLFPARGRVPSLEDAQAPGGLSPWLRAFLQDAAEETETLRLNGAEQAAAARTALLKKLVAAARAWLEAELQVGDAARESGVCEETIRRAVRDGRIPDRRANPKSRIRIRRGDLEELVAPRSRPYDPTADAQDIARLRRKV